MATLSLNTISPSSRLHRLVALPRSSVHSIPLSRLRRSQSQVSIKAASSGSAVATSASGVNDSIIDALGQVSIYSGLSGEAVLIKDLWDQTGEVAVVALLRHFGCVCCWELASVLRDAKPKFDSAGVKLIAIGVGTPDKARILAERLPFPLENLYADPDRKAYYLLGLYYGLARTFLNPASRKAFSRFEAIKEATKNYTIKATPDDVSSVLQQGGMFVFRGKELMYARKDEGTGDHAPLEDVLNICCEVPVA
ncbi:Prostamide/prostaglandin F synthase [Rhynchospora pubera]|uniref:Prostamide/prostaglandin F synthase n=1 Tax=Rhynchospora pubera TaxID=906938 RepID=A0AAV8FJS9_9POAL|nr:Prostamide/prostaglandin F synthase [Rhynchospora pubera]